MVWPAPADLGRATRHSYHHTGAPNAQVHRLRPGRVVSVDKARLVHGRLIRRLRQAAATGQRPDWADRAAHMVLDLEARMWAAGTTPPPRPL